ncbi:MAG: repeat-containing protein, partial [Planctomycetota bacterium]
GIRIQDSSGNRIGGPSELQRNVISRSRSHGIEITGDLSTNNQIVGNFIGTDLNGTNKNTLNGHGNRGYGVLIDGAPNNLIGGTAETAKNVIADSKLYGIAVVGVTATGNTIQGNFIGTEVEGKRSNQFMSKGDSGLSPVLDVGNEQGGILIQNAADTLIGNLTQLRGTNGGNLISGNLGYGIHIQGSGASNTRIQGNLIGTNASGFEALPNGRDGVFIDNAPDNVVGGTQTGAHNLISGNGGGEFSAFFNDNKFGSGVRIQGTSATGNKVQGNFIGPNLAGTTNILIVPRLGDWRNGGNTGEGVAIINASGNLIGGASPEAHNVISGNAGGVLVQGDTEFARDNIIQGNFIGTDVTGTLELMKAVNSFGVSTHVPGNRNFGISLYRDQGTVVGGESLGEGNVIANSGISNNPDDKPEDLLGRHGILMRGSQDARVIGNIIRKSTDRGVIVDGSIYGPETVFGNTIRLNSIYDNATLGIDLGGDGIDQNDPRDADSGVNGRQNAPAITRILPDPNLPDSFKTLEGELLGPPEKTFTIDFYANTTADDSGFGEGETYLRSIEVTTNEQGVATFSELFLVSETFIAATATDENGNTSEFSNSLALVVNDARDLDDADPNDNVLDIDLNMPGQQISLRAAIMAANVTEIRDVIRFDIPTEDAEPPVILVGATPLPVITKPVLIDGSTQPVAGRVWVQGGMRGPNEHGFNMTSDDVTLRGLKITNFGGDGVRSTHTKLDVENVDLSEGPHLNTVEIAYNGGWGVNSRGTVYVNQSTASIAGDGTVSRFHHNGIGDDDYGGGILSYRGGVTASDLEVTDNDAEGILALRNIEITSAVTPIDISRNRGSGVFSELGGVKLFDSRLQNQFTHTFNDNLGHGLYGHGFAGGSDTGAGVVPGVDLLGTVEVSRNSRWGISGGSSVWIGVNSETTTPVLQGQSRIIGNGTRNSVVQSAEPAGPQPESTSRQHPHRDCHPRRRRARVGRWRTKRRPRHCARQCRRGAALRWNARTLGRSPRQRNHGESWIGRAGSTCG